MKKKLCLLVVLSLIFTFAFAATASAQQQIKVLYDDKPLSFDVPPALENGRTMVPFRQIFETLGCEVDYDEATQTINAVNEESGDRIVLKINSSEVQLNDKTVKADAPPYVKNNRTMVPLRLVSELSDKDVLWDGKAATVLIYSKLENYEQVQKSGQAFTVGDGNLYYIGYNRKSAVCNVMQQPLAGGEAKAIGVTDPRISALQWADGKLLIEGVEDFYLYNPVDGSVNTLTYQPQSWLYNVFAYGDDIYGAHSYALQSGRRDVKTLDFAKMPQAGGEISLLNDEMEAENDYTVYNDRIFAENKVEDLKSGKQTDIFQQEEDQYFLDNDYAVCGDYYYNVRFTERYDYYYEYWCELVKYNYLTGEKQAQKLNLSEDDPIRGMAATDNAVYFVINGGWGESKLCRADLNGNHIVPLVEVSYYYNNCELNNGIIVSDNQIIYSVYDYETDSLIYKAVNTDGTNNHTLCKVEDFYYSYSPMDASAEYAE